MTLTNKQMLLKARALRAIVIACSEGVSPESLLRPLEIQLAATLLPIEERAKLYKVTLEDSEQAVAYFEKQDPDALADGDTMKKFRDEVVATHAARLA